jgi:hypothetical protein
MPRCCSFSDVMQCFDFRISTNKPGQSTYNSSLQASLDGTGSCQFIDLDRLCHALDRDWAESIDLD